VLAKNTSACAGFGFARKWLIAVYPKRPLNSLREPIPVHCFRSAWDDSKRKLRDGCWRAIIRSRAENVNFSAKTRPPVTIRVGLAPIDCPIDRLTDVSVLYDFLDRYPIVSQAHLRAFFSLICHSRCVTLHELGERDREGVIPRFSRDFNLLTRRNRNRSVDPVGEAPRHRWNSARTNAALYLAVASISLVRNEQLIRIPRADFVSRGTSISAYIRRAAPRMPPSIIPRVPPGMKNGQPRFIDISMKRSTLPMQKRHARRKTSDARHFPRRPSSGKLHCVTRTIFAA